MLSQKSKKAKRHAAILTSSPHNPRGHLLKGRSLTVEKKFEEGLSEMKKSVELGPSNEQICLDLARGYLAMKKP